MRALFLLAALTWAQPASAQFAVFAPGTPSDAADLQSPVKRATAALDRSPGAIPRLHTEGTLPGQGIREISIVAKRDQPLTLDFALAWRQTGDRRFLAQAERYLTAWADTYRLSFNPIDETGFDVMLMATDLVAADLSVPARAAVDAFWRRMAQGYLRAMERPRGHAITNWQSHRVKLATLAAYRTGDARLIARARAAYRAQIAANLRADGSTFDFEERDALHYVTYSLDPLMTAALAARAHGEDWFGWGAPSGASLPRSLDWLAAFARGERTHIEFVRSTIAFDRERAAAGQKEYAPHPWSPGGSVNSFAIAAALDPRFGPLATELAARYNRRPPDWLRAYQAR
ncbi:alginate lyase family protein [Sphingomonas sp. CJ20]